MPTDHTVTPKFPPRRLLAVAAALALIGGQAEARDGMRAPKAASDAAVPTCPLGSFHCAPRPMNYAMCRPNALLEFYDPSLDADKTQRDSSDTQAQAQNVDSSDQTIYRLSGNVKLRRADQLLQADKVNYNDNTTDYDARGNVRYQEAGQLLAATHMRGNTVASQGVADNVRYQMLAARGNGVAKQAHMLDAEHTNYQQATYSTCDVGHHVWEFRAKSIKINQDTGVGVARNATMRVGKVPFLYLPYLSFPTDDRRKSGFLYPTFGKTSRSGFQISTPYYLNLAPNYDATLDPRLYSLRGPMLAGEFRYLVPGSAGQLNVEYVASDRGTSDGLTNTKDKQRYLVNFSDVTHLWDSWSLVSSLNRASDSSYLYDYGDYLSGSTVYQLSSSVAIQGGGTWWSAAVGGVDYQNLNPFLPDRVLPYQQLPYANFGMNVPLTNWLEFGLNAQAVAFRKPDFVEGQREDLYPYLSANFGTSAWFVRPKVAYRYTAYQLNNGYNNYGYGGRLGAGGSSPFTQASPSRALPIVSVDSGLVFDRKASLFGNSYTQTLEPRLYYLYVPYRNQNNLPVFDTNLMSFDYWQLFSPNQFSGADRQMDANNLTAALTTRLLDDSGVERLSASIGQIHYFTPQRVLGTDWTSSAYVAEFGVQLDDRWRVNSSYQWSPNTRQTDLGALSLQRRIGGDGLVNFSYRYRRGLLEQYSASTVYPVSDRWRLVGSATWSVPDRRMVEMLAGVQYDSCCVTLKLVDRSYVNLATYGFGAVPNGVPINQRDNAIMFEVVFKGLGSTGGQIDPLLHRDILGYQ
ncbi:MAG: LPS assembly protein LptD [Rhodanobacter sp.]